MYGVIHDGRAKFAGLSKVCDLQDLVAEIKASQVITGQAELLVQVDGKAIRVGYDGQSVLLHGEPDETFLRQKFMPAMEDGRVFAKCRMTGE